MSTALDAQISRGGARIIRPALERAEQEYLKLDPSLKSRLARLRLPERPEASDKPRI